MGEGLWPTVYTGVGEGLWPTVCTGVGEGFWPTVCTGVGEGLWPTVCTGVGEGLWPTVCTGVGEGLWPTVCTGVGEGLWPTVCTGVGEGLWPRGEGYGLLHVMTGVMKQAKIDSSRKISEFFSSQQSSPSPTKKRSAETQTSLTVSGLTVLEGKASNSERVSSLEQVS